MKSLIRVLAAFLLVISTARADTPATKAAISMRPTRVLFIGNSYTAYNGSVPAVLRGMADRAGVPFEAGASLMDGRSLEWHYEHGAARDAIARGGWDFVVLQDQSRRAIDKPAKLAEYARKFDAEIRKAGARTVFYMTWARQHQPEKQAVIAKVYLEVATAAGATIAPVGLAWQRALTQRKDLTLHFDDKSHPNPAGTYLAACVFYRVLLHHAPPEFVPPIKNQHTGQSDQLDPVLATFLRDVAAETCADTRSSGPATSHPVPAGVAD